MEINRNNYEAYLLDLMEGNLSREDRQKLKDFLKMNPDCAPYSGNFDTWSLEKESLSFVGKEQLKKVLPQSGSLLSDSNFDLFSIARMERDLTSDQEMEHEAVLEHNPKKRSEWEQWQQTRLQASQVVFPGKKKLKKPAGVNGRIIWISVISAAAAVALLFALLRMEADLPETEMANEVPAQQPVSEDPQSELTPRSTPQGEETLAAVDEPVMFSIKKHPERPMETVEKKQATEKAHTQDSLRIQQAKKIESRPVRLAAYESYSKDLVKGSEYDQITPLDLPPVDIHISSLSLAQISEIDLQQALDEYTEEKNISLWSVANAGIKGINKLTGSDISLLASRDEQGEVSGFLLKSKRFSLTRPIDRAEEFAE